MLVEHLTLVPAVRLMYAIAFVSMTAMFFGRHRFTRESEMGVRKRQESRNGSLLGSLKEYRQVTKELFANAPLMIIFCVYVLFQFQQTMKNTFLSLFLVEHLQVGAAAVSLFPAVTSAVMLLLMYKAVPRLKEAHAVRYMIGGFALSLLSNVILIFQSPGSLFWLILSTVLAASGSILTYAYLEAAVANSLDDEKRAASFSILTVLILICIAPSGMIGGWAYALHPAVPFALICVAFLLSIALMVRYKNRYLPADSSGDIV
ncbi:hypothetical protein [Paenibacillus konkukensis]|uniref:hypothetical protein n=1 Tax=Paenibacillus konkukensis TaxID=2020716 RepID=UPI00201D851C|nr:hypothetical protein [Paenibacillus konkukensis]